MKSKSCSPRAVDPRTRAKLAWRCRRGTRELDYLLSGFLQRRYEQLDERDRLLFGQLLEEQDPVLVDWIWGQGTAPEKNIARLITLIREDAAAAFSGKRSAD